MAIISETTQNAGDTQGLVTLIAALVSALAALGALTVSYQNHRVGLRRSRLVTSNADTGLEISVINVGGQPISVLKIGIQWRPWVLGSASSGKYKTYPFGTNERPLPQRIDPGHAELWKIPWTELAEEVAIMESLWARWPGRLRKLQGRAVVFADTAEDWRTFSLGDIHEPWYDGFWALVEVYRNRIPHDATEYDPFEEILSELDDDDTT